MLAAVLGATVVSGLWLGLAASKGLEARRLRSAAGREGLSGRMGVVRSWDGPDGRVFVDGALWHARPSWPEEPHPAAGDQVVVERVSGLTLAVRRAEEWEEPW